MRGKVFCCSLFLAFLLACGANAATREMTASEWIEAGSALLGASEREIVERLGSPEKSKMDDLLSVKIAIYPIMKNDEGIRTGEFYYEDGIAVALRTNFSGDGHRVVNRFVLQNIDEILASGDLYAIAGASYDCDLYRVVEISMGGASAYLLRGAFYRRMSDMGDIPSLPPRDGCKGYAA